MFEFSLQIGHDNSRGILWFAFYTTKTTWRNAQGTVRSQITVLTKYTHRQGLATYILLLWLISGRVLNIEHSECFQKDHKLFKGIPPYSYTVQEDSGIFLYYIYKKIANVCSLFKFVSCFLHICLYSSWWTTIGPACDPAHTFWS